jgi:hypothetical protein
MTACAAIPMAFVELIGITTSADVREEAPTFTRETRDLSWEDELDEAEPTDAVGVTGVSCTTEPDKEEPAIALTDIGTPLLEEGVFRRRRRLTA